MAFKLDYLRELTQITTLQDSAVGIMRWGHQNAFPQTLKNLVEQSPNAKPAVSRTAKFLKGSGFVGEDLIVHPSGYTLKQLVSDVADEFALFNGLSIHANYNLNFQVSSLINLKLANCRFNEFDELNYAGKVGYHYNFGLNSEIRKTVQSAVTRGYIKWFNRFNPKEDAVKAQMENEGGIANYNGQVLYYSEEGSSLYPIPLLQAQVNFVLADIEVAKMIRKDTSTGFLDAYLLKTTLAYTDPNLVALEQSIASAQGVDGQGKVITLSGLSSEEISGTLLESLAGKNGSNATIDKAEKTYNLCKKAITGAYLIPPVLAGIDVPTGFSVDDLENAYVVFNAITAEGRSKIEAQINRMLAASIFPVKEIKIQPLQLNVQTEKQQPVETPGEVKEAIRQFHAKHYTKEVIAKCSTQA